MTDTTGKELGGRMLVALRSYVERVVNALDIQIEQKLSAISTGENGLDGKDGINGKDGDPGLPGKDGVPGLDGKDGEPGKPGERGEPGIRGEKGIDGRDGRDAQDGRDGADGIEGPPGRDALELEILPAIDETKRYPRGTYATHSGGIWKAEKHTEGMRGWECKVAGLPTLEVIQSEDLRTFTFKVTSTAGDITEKSFYIPAMIYREVYSPAIQYKRGDVVTWGGSSWHCQTETEAKPGTNGEWKMMVKEGRPGKDGKDGGRGDPGPEGKKGRDLTQLSFNGEKH